MKQITSIWEIGSDLKATQFLKKAKQHLSILSSVSLLSCFLFVSNLQAQDYNPVKSIQIDGADITTDYLGNLYIFNKFRISKYDLEGKPLFTFEDYRNGHISSVDVSDPMKILIYYQDFMVLKVLDKTLSEIASYPLPDIGYYSVSAIAHSRDDNFWVFDNTSFELKKIEENGKALYMSEKFSLLFEETVQVDFMLDYENNLYINDTENGIYVFDRFGTYQKKIPLKGLKSFQIIQGVLVYYEEGVLRSYNLNDLREEEMKLPVWVEAQFCRIQKDRIYIVEKDRVSIYTYK